jgi:LysM repeat protein
VAKVTVRKGDTLAKIGARYAVAPLKIARANYLANPNLIYPGQRLCIPFRGVPRGSTIP